MTEAENKKFKRLRIAKRILLGIIVLYMIFLVAVNSDALSPDNAKRMIFNIKKSFSSEKRSEISVDTSDGFSVKPFKDGFVTLTKGQLTVYSSDFHVYSTYGIGLANPVLRVSDRYILCYDRGGKRLYVTDSFNILFEHEYEKGIINADIDRDGCLVVAVNGDDEDSSAGSDRAKAYKGAVLVYDKEYNKIFRWWSADGYIADVVATSKNNIQVITVEAEGTGSDTVIRSFNYRSVSGQEREVVRVDGRIALMSELKSDGSLELFSTYDVVSVRGEGYNVIRDLEGENVVLAVRGKDYSMIASVLDRSRKIYLVTAFDTVGNVCFSREFDSVSTMAVYGSDFYVESARTVIRLDRSGNITGSAELESAAIQILPIQRKVLLVGVNKILKLDFSQQE